MRQQHGFAHVVELGWQRLYLQGPAAFALRWPSWWRPVGPHDPLVWCVVSGAGQGQGAEGGKLAEIGRLAVGVLQPSRATTRPARSSSRRTCAITASRSKQAEMGRVGDKLGEGQRLPVVRIHRASFGTVVGCLPRQRPCRSTLDRRAGRRRRRTDRPGSGGAESLGRGTAPLTVPGDRRAVADPAEVHYDVTWTSATETASCRVSAGFTTVALSAGGLARSSSLATPRPAGIGTRNGS